ncbi:unnamed protein product [Amoebophrya sp. A25]|nr:unnamed protein product [Amoebophrya sp. A25]|eukprot:GSA25T00023800001.1
MNVKALYSFFVVNRLHFLNLKNRIRVLIEYMTRIMIYFRCSHSTSSEKT